MQSGLLHHLTVAGPSEDTDPLPDQEEVSTPGGLHATALQFTRTQAAPGDGHKHGTPHLARGWTKEGEMVLYCPSCHPNSRAV